MKPRQEIKYSNQRTFECLLLNVTLYFSTLHILYELNVYVQSNRSDGSFQTISIHN